MSTMISPDLIPPEIMAHIEICASCEADRRPRISVCDYHDGYWEGWEARETEMEVHWSPLIDRLETAVAETTAEVELLRSVVRAIDPATVGPDGTWLEILIPDPGLTAEQAEAVKRAMEER